MCSAVAVATFDYCPFMCLFCNKGATKEIFHKYKSIFRMLHEDYEYSFEILPNRSGNVCIHTKTVQKLMIEIYKFTNHLLLSLVCNFL